MKKIISYSVIAAVAIAGAIFIIFNPFGAQENSPVKIEAESEMPAFSKEKQKWQFIRYRDPATNELPHGIRTLENKFINDNFRKNVKNPVGELQENDWQRRGPWHIGGRTRALALDVRDENTILAGGVSGGMWKSTDAGVTWYKTSRPDQLHSVTCIIQDKRPGNRDIWYYATGELWGNSADISGDGIYKSTDNGESWNPIESTLSNTPQSTDSPFDYVWNLQLDQSKPADETVLVAATARYGVHKSTDGGDTWIGALPTNGGTLFSDAVITPNGVYYATLDSLSGGGGIFRSNDGENWVNITPENFPTSFTRVVIGVAPSDENQVYFAAVSPGFGKWTTNSRGDDLWHSFWKYTYLGGDGTGENAIWEDRSENLPRPEKTQGHMNSQSGYNLVIGVNPNDPDIVFLGAVAFYRSTDGFATSENVDWIGGTCPFDDCDYHYRYPNHHADNHTIIFLPSNPNVLFSGSDGGVHKTVDNLAETVEWVSLNFGYYTTQFYALAIDRGTPGSTNIIGGMQDNGTVSQPSGSDHFVEWEDVSRGDGFYCLIPDGGEFYYSSQNSSRQPKIKIWRVKYNEDGSKITTRIDPIGGYEWSWNNPFILDPNDNNVMYVPGGRILWRNNDLSAVPFVESTDSITTNWDSLTTTNLSNFTSSTTEKMSAIDVSTQPADIVYYGTTAGKVFRLDNARDNESIPVDITDNKMRRGANVSSISIDPDDANHVLAAFSNYGVLSIFRTLDGGQNWEAISGNLEEQPDGRGAGPAVNWVKITKVGDKTVYYAGTSAGLFTTGFSDGMATVWKMEGENQIGNMVIDMIDYRREDNYMVIGTHGAGIYEAFIDAGYELPATTTLKFPENDAVDLLDTVTFEWNAYNSAEPVLYGIQISDSPDFSNIIYSEDGIASISATIDGIEQGLKEFYWRVRVQNSSGYGEYSESRKFTTFIAPPELLLPENDDKEQTTDVTLRWAVSEGADSYRLQVGYIAGFNNIILDTVISGTEFRLEGLNFRKRYNWRVLPVKDGKEGVFSEEYSFFTNIENSVENNSLADTRVIPNPSYGNFRIEISSATAVNSVIEIYDARGNKIFGSREFILPGINSVGVDLGSVPAGTYFYKIKTGKDSGSGILKIIR
jgi:hypothetical protein